jgi:hypothetical protein
MADVKPTDWGFQALQSLVERYGIVAAYRDRTFRQSDFVTRGELAQWIAGFAASTEHMICITEVMSDKNASALSGKGELNVR